MASVVQPPLVKKHYMSTPFSNTSFGSGQPHRRILKGRFYIDAQGKEVFQPVEGEADIISDEKSLDKLLPQFDAFLDCGCSLNLNAPRFRCYEPGCPAVVCLQHIKYCQTCSKPICPQHCYVFEIAPGQQVPMCETHYREAKRRRLWQRVAKIAASPFVTFDNRDSSK